MQLNTLPVQRMSFERTVSNEQPRTCCQLQVDAPQVPL